MFDDVATMTSMVLFYRNTWERRSECSAVAELWREATAQLYSSDTESAKQILKRAGEELRKAKDEGVDPNQIVQECRAGTACGGEEAQYRFQAPILLGVICTRWVRRPHLSSK